MTNLPRYLVLPLALALATPAAADDPRTWTLWSVHYIQILTKDDDSKTAEKTTRWESDLTRTECELIKMGKVGDARADRSLYQPFPDGASLLDQRNSRLLITQYLCSKATPSNPPPRMGGK
jgi:hypothetical protein